MTPAVALAVLAEFEGTTVYEAAHTAYHTGMRRSEVAGLTWARVGLDARLIEEAQARKKRVGGGENIIGRPKYGSVRTIAMTTSTQKLLRAHIERQQALFEELERVWSPDTFVFLDEEGEPIHLHSITSAVKAATRRAGYPDFTFHAFRRGHVSALANRGVHPKTTQERLGHKNIETTLQFYTDVKPEMDRGATDVFDDPLNWILSRFCQMAHRRSEYSLNQLWHEDHIGNTTHNYVDPCLRRLTHRFVVLTQPTTPAQPSECSFNHPSARQHLKPRAGPRTPDDFKLTVGQAKHHSIRWSLCANLILAI